jgi:hypothetical protein
MIWCADPWRISRCAAISFSVSRAAIILHDDFNCCNGLWCHYLVCLTRSRTVCYRTNAGHELLNLYPTYASAPVRTLAVVTDMHHHTELPFVDELRWVSTLHYAVLLWYMLQGGSPSLHYYCAVVLHSCIVLPPVGHSSNNEHHCCQLIRQSSFEFLSHF